MVNYSIKWFGTPHMQSIFFLIKKENGGKQRSLYLPKEEKKILKRKMKLRSKEYEKII